MICQYICLKRYMWLERLQRLFNLIGRASINMVVLEDSATQGFPGFARGEALLAEKNTKTVHKDLEFCPTTWFYINAWDFHRHTSASSPPFCNPFSKLWPLVNSESSVTLLVN